MGGVHHLQSPLLHPNPAIPPYAVRTPHPGTTDDLAHITNQRHTMAYMLVIGSMYCICASVTFCSFIWACAVWIEALIIAMSVLCNLCTLHPIWLKLASCKFTSVLYTCLSYSANSLNSLKKYSAGLWRTTGRLPGTTGSWASCPVWRLHRLGRRMEHLQVSLQNVW